MGLEGNILSENPRNNLEFFYNSRKYSFEYLQLFQNEVGAPVPNKLIIWRKRISINTSPYLWTAIRHCCLSCNPLYHKSVQECLSQALMFASKNECFITRINGIFKKNPHIKLLKMQACIQDSN